ncbi:MAG: TauD/TfdA dioxygenase family protein [Alphaproteobacteria bacterium]
MSLEIIPLTNHFAAEAKGIDLRETQDEQTRLALYNAFAENTVLLIRDQELNPESYLQAASNFGQIFEQDLKQFCLDENPLVGFISSGDRNNLDGKRIYRGINWHTDHSNRPVPPRATSLYGVTIPQQGGDTQFADMKALYDDLPEGTKAKIDHVKTLHVWQASRSPRPLSKPPGKQPETWQPLVRVNPDTGRRGIYMNTARIEKFDGIDDSEGFAIVDHLMELANSGKYEYRHKWRKGDMVIWDNRSVLHQATSDYDEERFLYRVMIQGEPVMAVADQKAA